jgi:hypothetical protein
VVSTRSKGNRSENAVKALMESKGYIVEKQKAKYWKAAGNTDFFGCFDLVCLPTEDCEEDFPHIQMIQVRSRKQYGKEKQPIQEFVNATVPIFKAYIAWPIPHPTDKRKKVWEFEQIEKARV